MWIYLLRHGVAEDRRDGGADEERALTDEGVRKLRRAAEAWSELVETPAVILSSPLVRARQTAGVFAEAVGFDGAPDIDDALVPHAAPALATTRLESELLAGTRSVALVGHEPHLGLLLGALLTGDARLAVPLKKGMLVALETGSPTNVLAGLRFALTQKAAGRLA
mgnify:CR=1 FL=1